jgi:hypothetical protein
VQLRHELSALQLQVRGSVPLSQLEKLTAKVSPNPNPNPNPKL